MSATLDLPVLDVNRLHQAIDVRSVRDAITALTGDKPAVAFDIEYHNPGVGLDWGVAFYRPVHWDEWITLPVRSFDEAIGVKGGYIRAPRVIAAPEYAHMPRTRPTLSPRAIYERDKYVCQYTGRKLRPEEANIDHVIPKDRGGRNTWENLVTCDRKINSWKGNRLNHEIGLKLIRKPSAPSTIPRCATIRRAAHPSWRAFLTIVEEPASMAA